MDSMCLYKDKLNEALTLILSMSEAKRIEAINYWNNSATQLQIFINAKESVDQGSLIPSDGGDQISLLNDESCTRSGTKDKEHSNEGTNSMFSNTSSHVRSACDQSMSGSDNSSRTGHCDETTAQEVMIESTLAIDSYCSENLLERGIEIDEQSTLTYGANLDSDQCNQRSTSGPMIIDEAPTTFASPVEGSTEFSDYLQQPELRLSSSTQLPMIPDTYCSGGDSYSELIESNEQSTLSANNMLKDGMLFNERASESSTVISTSMSDAGNKLDCCPLEQTGGFNYDSIYNRASFNRETDTEFLADTGGQSSIIPALTYGQQDLNTCLIVPQLQKETYIEQSLDIIHSHAILTSTSDGVTNFVNNDDCGLESITIPQTQTESNTIPSPEKTCDICGKSGFSTKGNLKRHLKSHSGEKPYKCEHCDTKFTEKKSLKIHVRKHTGEKPYKCELCDKEFSQKGVLKLHMTTHIDKRKFECKQCGRAFRQRSQLNLHVMRHNGTKKLTCSTCEAKFLTKGDLERHFRIHTGERPYPCKLCDKTFTRQQLLNEHVNRHVGRKPHACLHCGKSFAETSALYKHTKTHQITGTTEN